MIDANGEGTKQDMQRAHPGVHPRWKAWIGSGTEPLVLDRNRIRNIHRYLAILIRTPVSLCERLRTGTVPACAFVLALNAASTCLAIEPVWPAITEPPTSHYVPGRWVWAELFTEDVKAATRFYGAAFGWSFQVFPGPRGRDYTLAFSDGEPVGGMIQREHTYQKESGSRWLGMISVTDVEAAARYAADHGGKVVVAPRLLPGRGEMALLADPEGAPFGVIRSSAGDPPDYLAEDRQWVWLELWARDPESMAKFYAGLAGYEIASVKQPDGRKGYLLASGGYTRCGIVASPAASVAGAWLFYLKVDDVKVATKQAEQAGARVVVPPGSAIQDGRVALIVDPAGAALGLAEMIPSEIR